ncbi:MAG: 16S rRNA methyltransferase [Thermoplasmataceae archaeon]
MLELLIIDAELQLIPEIMKKDKTIIRIARERKKTPEDLLLDSNFMHSSIDKCYPGKSNRMGRPDIFHMLMNTALESILNKTGNMSLSIHTVENKFIRIDSGVRIPKSYNRFVGLMEKLLKKGILEAPDGKILMRIEDIPLKKLLSDGKRNVVLSPTGNPVKLDKILNSVEDVRIIIGGFSECYLITDLSDIRENYSIFTDELTIWVVAYECIVNYEHGLGIS